MTEYTKVKLNLAQHYSEDEVSDWESENEDDNEISAEKANEEDGFEELPETGAADTHGQVVKLKLVSSSLTDDQQSSSLNENSTLKLDGPLVLKLVTSKAPSDETTDATSKIRLKIIDSKGDSSEHKSAKRPKKRPQTLLKDISDESSLEVEETTVKRKGNDDSDEDYVAEGEADDDDDGDIPQSNRRKKSVQPGAKPRSGATPNKSSKSASQSKARSASSKDSSMLKALKYMSRKLPGGYR